ncbi:alpha-1,3-mannosyltransferase [Achlya hypogyna]|uniref:Alpha-1,3/1,6-mannosyltransferase ALG2 n=1 Tax=Achlya hypogyna TaxID=1202772 RepID=A0A1V9YAC3_ACHHY|nr:alpha-1,3-mannosyltransferase [Achlya hypogyna]
MTPCGCCTTSDYVVWTLAAAAVWIVYAGFFRSIRPHKANGATALKVSFLHPDLGIGGAENLIVNAAVALQSKGHTVHLFTSHHDVGHCFEETRGTGSLARFVVVYGDWLPRTILGRMYAACAILRMLYITGRLALQQWDADVFFVDQVALPVPLLRALLGRPVYFYGHYPDKLLCVDRASRLKQLYRYPLDKLEELTTCAADTIVVNSKFTASVFQNAFPMLQSRQLSILYPPVNLADFAAPVSPDAALAAVFAHACVFVSLNRYERKKNIALAIEALAALKKRVSSTAFSSVHLVVAGGYDPLNVENAEHLAELRALAAAKELTAHITFLTSVSSATKQQLLWRARAILYTPSFEHFGIVPVEAMACGTPVVAADSGGPLESIVHGETGFHCAPTGDAWAAVLATLLENANKLTTTLGGAGKRRAAELFSLEAFATTLDRDMRALAEGAKRA